MPAQLNIFLLLFGALQGLLISVLLVQRKVYRTAYVFLIVYIAVMILQILLKVASKVWLMQNLSMLYFISYRLPFLYGPLAYLLTLYLLRKKTGFSPVSVLHLLPFVVAVFTMLYYFQTGRDSYFVAAFMDGNIFSLLQIISILVYHGLALREWRKHNISVKNYFSDIRKFQLSWLKMFIWLSLIVCSLITAAIYFMYLYFPLLNDLKLVFIALTVFIYWVSYAALKQPQVFSVTYGFAGDEAPGPLINKLIVHRAEKKYANSGLNEEEVARVTTVLEHLMSKRKLYLDAEIDIEKLAASIPCSRHHLSQVLNEKLDRSFYDYINQYRVEEAKLLLKDPSRAHHKIASIAYDAGFNSLSSFNEVFKKIAGETPSHFRKHQGEVYRQQRV
jgi:AraC-like DNA-binding protein